jgi:D-alanine-D-alanine ligase
MKNIFVVMGGPSEEHEISLKTGFEMLTHLDSDKYNTSALIIDKQKHFYLADKCELLSETDLNNPAESELFSGPFSPADAVSLWRECDLALLGLHGEFGEDGVFQGYLETIDVPYTGCGVAASAIGMHKSQAKKILEASGIPTPPYSIYREGDSVELIAARRGLPCFVKAPQSGSSKLLGKANNLEELKSMLAEFIQEAPSVLVETLIDGEEFSIPVLEEINGVTRALTPVFIKPAEGHFFDYEAKYQGLSEEIVPPPHSQELQDQLKMIAEAVHKVLECTGLSRTDIIVKDGTPYVLEVNTLPGFTKQSLFPQSYASEGKTFNDLLNVIIERALAK